MHAPLTGEMTDAKKTSRPGFVRGLTELRLNNWPGALVVFLIGMPVTIILLPPAVSFWVSAGLAALLAASLIVNAWGRYTGGLLVTPALALLFVMNIFPLLWSFGLSFFSYRANRMKAPVFVGLRNYENVITDPVVWDRLHTTAIMVVLTVSVQMVVGSLLAILFAKQFPLRRYLMILVLTPMMLSFVAVGAFFRYYYEPSLGLLSQFVRLFTGEPYVLMQLGMGCTRRHHFCRCLDVVPVCHAVGARRPRQRAEISLRGGRNRPGPGLAAVLVNHAALYPGAAAVGAAVSHH